MEKQNTEDSFIHLFDVDSTRFRKKLLYDKYLPDVEFSKDTKVNNLCKQIIGRKNKELFVFLCDYIIPDLSFIIVQNEYINIANQLVDRFSLFINLFDDFYNYSHLQMTFDNMLKKYKINSIHDNKYALDDFRNGFKYATLAFHHGIIYLSQKIRTKEMDGYLGIYGDVVFLLAYYNNSDTEYIGHISNITTNNNYPKNDVKVSLKPKHFLFMNNGYFPIIWFRLTQKTMMEFYNLDGVKYTENDGIPDNIYAIVGGCHSNFKFVCSNTVFGTFHKTWNDIVGEIDENGLRVSRDNCPITWNIKSRLEEVAYKYYEKHNIK